MGNRHLLDILTFTFLKEVYVQIKKFIYKFYEKNLIFFKGNQMYPNYLSYIQ